MTATLAQLDAAIERAKRPPRPVRQEGETVKDYRFRMERWHLQCRAEVRAEKGTR
jgi:hypothetical protein